MKVKVGPDRYIGEGHPCFIIAEAGINHNGDLELAKKMVAAASECGVDAIKFQTFKSEEFVSDPEATYTYYSRGEPVTESMLQMFKRYEFSPAEWKGIIECCREKGIIFLTTPQNPNDLDFILELTELPLIKVGSDDLTNLELLGYYAGKGIPMMISAGMAFAAEIEDAVTAIRNRGNQQIIVLHCVSSYPAGAEEINLRKLQTIQEAFQVIVGYSDHSRGFLAAAGAVLLGAQAIEKHFTLDKHLPGPDHWFSADVPELQELVAAVRYLETAMGSPQLVPTDKEMDMRKLARRSIVAAEPLKKGQEITRAGIAFKRPGTGLPPKFAADLLDKKVNRDINKDEMITFEDIG